MFLAIYVKAPQHTGAEDTVGKLTDHNSESDKRAEQQCLPIQATKLD